MRILNGFYLRMQKWLKSLICHNGSWGGCLSLFQEPTGIKLYRLLTTENVVISISSRFSAMNSVHVFMDIDTFPLRNWASPLSCSIESIKPGSTESRVDNNGNIWFTSTLVASEAGSTDKQYQWAFCVTIAPKKSARAWRPAELNGFIRSCASSGAAFLWWGIECKSGLDAQEVEDYKRY